MDAAGAVEPRATESFLAELVELVRAHAEGDAAGDLELLGRFLAGASRPGEPELDAFWRLELFHAAVAATVERRTGVACHPLLRMHGEGFGRVAVVAGRLALVSRWIDDVHGFAFASIEALAQAGERLAAEGAELVRRYPELARGG